MSFEYLKSIDHSFSFDFSTMNLRDVDLLKVNKAWAEGHYVYMNFIGKDFKDVGIRIFTVTSKNGVDRQAEEITRDWIVISKLLVNDELPDEWVEKAIAFISKKMEE